jgi:hypothetical protein
MEFAALVRQAYLDIDPDCVAVELAETMQLQLLHAASRLPDVSVIHTSDIYNMPVYYLCEPCDAAFEGLRSALEDHKPAFCIDLDVDDYPAISEPIPDPYAITRIGHKEYYDLYKKYAKPKAQQDHDRELYMAKRLKELSFHYERILVVVGLSHADALGELIKRSAFPVANHAIRDIISLATLSETSTAQVMAENSWITCAYEERRREKLPPPDRQHETLALYKAAAARYLTNTGNKFPGYNIRNLMKFARNYAFITDNLVPDTFQILSAAKGCVDHNYAYEVWELACIYPYANNVDNLPVLDLTPKDIWGHSKILQFHLKQKNEKSRLFQQRRKDKSQFKFQPPSPFSICSYPPEDVVVESFGEFLQKKGTQILADESGRTIPFSTSLEDGIDTRETIRHWHEKKLYVKAKGKPPGGVGSVVIIFNEDDITDTPQHPEKYTWKTTWLGEHEQESDMAFYATDMQQNIIGPGISRCEYGGFMMSYPPRRMFNIWDDPDYESCRNKPEVLLAAAIDYAVKPVVVYVAAKPPRTIMRSYASRFGKKIVYIPIGQLSPILLNRVRAFHVLGGHDKRRIADEYIF